MKKLLLATTNFGKIQEYKNFFELHQCNISLFSLNDFNKVQEPKEDGTTFFDNALIKAQFYYEQFKIPVLTDDSGLVVPSLNGEPGVLSARYAETKNSHLSNLELVLHLMKDIPKEKRDAYFYSSLILFDNNQILQSIEGQCHGFIAYKAKGNQGFGYDPIFFLPEYNKRMSQVTIEEKNKISHRGKAIINMLAYLTKWSI